MSAYATESRLYDATESRLFDATEKVNFVDSRLHSAEHSSELDALLSLAREFAPLGLLVVVYATELRLFDARCASVYAPRARGRKFLMIDC